MCIYTFCIKPMRIQGILYKYKLLFTPANALLFCMFEKCTNVATSRVLLYLFH